MWADPLLIMLEQNNEQIWPWTDSKTVGSSAGPIFNINFDFLNHIGSTLYKYMYGIVGAYMLPYWNFIVKY